ncbi:EamA family transporter [Subtercola sp. Z020]|uniref:DMT family transporter n=1 Tax=Subtercola sp. Z020 TaxID=2080582 RepID=UPI000CE83455|nr:EamA family transporter [Subtercola sp. Z020]PPF77851.1 EamA family transporter [Subtercola sp. Z020]
MTSPSRSSSRRGTAAALLVVGAAVCFGTTGTAQSLGAPDASAFALGAARIVFGGALLAVIALVALRVDAAPSASAQRDGRRDGRPASSRDARRATLRPDHRRGRIRPSSLGRARIRPSSLALVAVGAIGVAAYQPSFFTGTQQNGVAVGTLVALGSAPVLTGLLEWGVRRRAPGIRWAVATVVAALGVAVLSGVFAPGGGDGRGTVTVAGLLGSLGAGASYAVYALSSKLLLDRGWAPTAAMGATFGAAALIMTPVLLTSDLAWLSRPGGLLSTAWLAVVTVALAYTLFARGLRRLPASRAATLTLVEPLTATVLGVLLLHEQFTAAIVVGLLLLVAGILILTIGRRPPRSVPNLS